MSIKQKSIKVSNSVPTVNSNALSIDLKLEYTNLYGSIYDRLDYFNANISNSNNERIVIVSNGSFAASFVMCNPECRNIIAVLPELVGDDFIPVLKSFNVQILRTTWNSSSTSKESSLGTAQRLTRDYSNSTILTEFDFFDSSFVQSIVDDVASSGVKYDYVTIPLISKLFFGLSVAFEKIGIKTIGVLAKDSFGSLGLGQLMSPSKVSGLYVPYPYSFNTDTSNIESVYQINDFDAFNSAKELHMQGIMCGPMSGGLYSAAKQHGRGKILCLLPDSAFHYQNTLLNKTWLMDNDLLNVDRRSLEVFEYVVADLDLSPVISITPETLIKTAMELMLEREFDQLPVVDEQKKMVGFITLGHLESLMKTENVLNDAVEKWMYKWAKKRFIPVTLETCLKDLIVFFERNSVAFVTDSDSRWVVGVCTKYDLLKFAQRVRPISNSWNK